MKLTHNEITSDFKSDFKQTNIIFIIIIALLCICLSVSIKQCRGKKIQYKTNIVAAHDTIHHYITNNHDTVYYKQGYSAEIEELKVINRKLYDELRDMKLKPKETQTVVHTETKYINTQQLDTQYVVKHDTIRNGFAHDFNFNDQYRQLEGTVEYHPDTLDIHIDKDIVNFDYTLAIDKDNRVYMKSDNPYVHLNEITSITIPKPKRTHWSLGPSIQYNYDPFNKKHSFGIGVSLQYNLLKF